MLARDRGRDEPSRPAIRPALLLLTSLPIYWPEADDVAGMLRPEPAHWARRALERRWSLVPLDTLEPGALEGRERLLLAQPRPLAPAENVALDAWVRGGGRLLLFADPALTADSAFALGDRRRPQDLVLLSPILSRWGLELTFDPDQPLAGRPVELAGGATMPVRLGGRFALARHDAPADCALAEQGLVARCTIGRGRVVAVADAALFETAVDARDESSRSAALAALVARAF